jgi:hypothetical protein
MFHKLVISRSKPVYNAHIRRFSSDANDERMKATLRGIFFYSSMLVGLTCTAYANILLISIFPQIITDAKRNWKKIK